MNNRIVHDSTEEKKYDLKAGQSASANRVSGN